MSHVAKVEAMIRDLDALEQTVTDLGGVLHRDQRTFRMWGSAQPCLHAISIKGARDAYEIGLRLKDAADPNTFEFACDFMDGRLTQQFGPQLVNLRNGYLATVAEKQLRQQRYRVQRQVVGQQIRLVATQ
jgi:hypothetical protein